MDDGTDAPQQAGAPSSSGIVGPEHLETMTSFLSEAIYIFDREGNLKARLSPPGGVLGYGSNVGTNVFEHMHPDDVPRGLQIGAEAQEAQEGWTGEVSVRLRHADGTWRRFRLRLWNRHTDPAVGGMVASLRPDDPTHVPDGDDGVELDLGSISDGLPTAYLALGRGGRIRFASEAATELLHSGRDELLGLPIDELVIDSDRPAILAAYATLLTTTGARTVVVTTRPRFAGRVVEAELHTRGTDADHKVVTVVLVDHTDEPELIRLATRDPLTGLANRTKVIDTINGLLLAEEPRLSVVYVDLDDLKGINDVHGHEAGDRALVAVAQRLQHLVRPSDVVGRMSGDEFVIVCPDLDGSHLMDFVERVGQISRDPDVVMSPDGQPLRVAVSAGGATAAAGDTTSSLLRRADEAMFEAKRRPG